MNCSDVFPYGIYMLTYEYVNRLLDDTNWVKAKRRENMSETQVYPNNNYWIEMCVTIASGAIAGVMSWILVIPFDVMKTIIQAPSDPVEYRSMQSLYKTKRNVNYSVSFLTRRFTKLIHSVCRNMDGEYFFAAVGCYLCAPYRSMRPHF